MIAKVWGFNSMITRVAFYASKMQASSTANTKDSAGRRLGYFFINQELKNLEEKK